jgi:hypothetical protein
MIPIDCRDDSWNNKLPGVGRSPLFLLFNQFLASMILILSQSQSYSRSPSYRSDAERTDSSVVMLNRHPSRSK